MLTPPYHTGTNASYYTASHRYALKVTNRVRPSIISTNVCVPIRYPRRPSLPPLYIINVHEMTMYTPWIENIKINEMKNKTAYILYTTRRY